MVKIGAVSFYSISHRNIGHFSDDSFVFILRFEKDRLVPVFMLFKVDALNSAFYCVVLIV